VKACASAPCAARPEAEFAKRDFYDVWLPNLAPTDELVKQALAAETDAQWKAFTRRFMAEMKEPDKAHVLDMLAALSHQTDFSIGCYCVEESRCHRSVLRGLLVQRGAALIV
jgi:uncharacterized protein YeaO (DUF488 family)